MLYRFLVISYVLMGVCSHCNAQQEEKVFWSDSLEFSWDLFKEKKAGYSYMKAMTHSGILYEVDVKEGQVQIEVKAYFIYGKSWVMKGYKKPKLLAHEKMHFHIAEIYKRKLDKLVEKYRVDYQTFVSKNFQRKLQNDFNRIFDEMDAYQKLYDEETEHGTNSSEQALWVEKINKQLGLTGD